METLALGSVGNITQKNYAGKWNVWVKERKAQGKGPWLHTLADPDQALVEVLEFMACRCFVHNNPAVHREGVLGRDQVFSQDVRGLGVDHVPSYDNSRRKRDRSSARNGTEEGARPTAVDLVHFIAREASSEHHGRRRTCHVAGPRVVVFSVAQSVRALGVGKRKSAPPRYV